MSTRLARLLFAITTLLTASCAGGGGGETGTTGTPGTGTPVPSDAPVAEPVRPTPPPTGPDDTAATGDTTMADRDSSST